MPIYIQIEMATNIFFSTIHTYTNNSSVLYQICGDQIVVPTATFHHYQRTGKKVFKRGVLDTFFILDHNSTTKSGK
jgi:hypothetical protein